jgi:hypothetical protein
MSWWQQTWRRAIYGRPIVVVSGLPRSGTSMMMAMLEAGGVPVWTDGVRAADDQNPNGYYEVERIKDLDKPIDKGWLREGRGRAIKVISSLLEHLPAGNQYQVIFMNRDLAEVLQSQGKMLAQRGEGHDRARDGALAAAYAAHLRRVKSLLARDARFTALDIDYADVLADPQTVSIRIRTFLRARLNLERMAAAVDGGLYHNRSAPPS